MCEAEAPPLYGRKHREQRRRARVIAHAQRDEHGLVRCAYCSRGLADKDVTLDHIRPKARGGGSHFNNLAACCGDCNQAKGALTAEEFRALPRGARGGISKKAKRKKHVPDREYWLHDDNNDDRGVPTAGE